MSDVPSAVKFRLRKIWYYSNAIQGKLGDAQVYMGALLETAKAANVKNLEEVEKLLKEAYEHVSEAKRLVKIATEKIENELTGG